MSWYHIAEDQNLSENTILYWWSEIKEFLQTPFEGELPLPKTLFWNSTGQDALLPKIKMESKLF
jgi:hypothetical protein